MKKSGFTLVEILAVIVIIAVLSIIIAPNVVKYFDNSTEKTMKIQENEVLDAAKLFIEDFCHNPISKKHKEQCLSFEKLDSSGKPYFCISSLQNNISIQGFDTEPYLKEIKYKTNIPCDGFVIFKKNGNSYDEGRTYLVCKNAEDKSYSYTTEGYEEYNTELESCIRTEFKLSKSSNPSNPDNPSNPSNPSNPTEPTNPDDDIPGVDPIVNPNGKTLSSDFCKIKGLNGYYQGDVNRDNKVDTSDVMMMIGALINKSDIKDEYAQKQEYKDYIKDLSSNDLKICDLNEDAYLDTKDVIALYNCLLADLMNTPLVGPILSATLMV